MREEMEDPNRQKTKNPRGGGWCPGKNRGENGVGQRTWKGSGNKLEGKLPTEWLFKKGVTGGETGLTENREGWCRLSKNRKKGRGGKKGRDHRWEGRSPQKLNCETLR